MENCAEVKNLMKLSNISTDTLKLPLCSLGAISKVELGLIPNLASSSKKGILSKESLGYFGSSSESEGKSKLSNASISDELRSDAISERSYPNRLC